MAEGAILCGNCPSGSDSGTGLYCKAYGYQKDYYAHCDDCRCPECKDEEEDY